MPWTGSTTSPCRRWCLHALYTGDATALHEWLTMRPENAVTVLDTHDGIGVIDVGADQSNPESPGLLPPEAIDALVTTMHAKSGGSSAAATGAAASNLDLYQVNCTFYDALGADDRAYLRRAPSSSLFPAFRRCITWARSPDGTTWTCSNAPASAAISTATTTRRRDRRRTRAARRRGVDGAVHVP